MTRRSFAWLLLTACTLAGCTRVPPLASNHRSAEALATAVLDAIAHRDRAALERLALDEREFRDHVWPDLPAARPERNLPFSYVWGDLHQKSRLQLASTMEQQGGKRYRLRRVSFDGTTSYAHYVVHRESVFDVVDDAGVDSRVRLCGAFLEKDGVWKVFSYVVDD
jgi:hypothetical protein